MLDTKKNFKILESYRAGEKPEKSLISVSFQVNQSFPAWWASLNALWRGTKMFSRNRMCFEMGTTRQAARQQRIACAALITFPELLDAIRSRQPEVPLRARHILEYLRLSALPASAIHARRAGAAEIQPPAASFRPAPPAQSQECATRPQTTARRTSAGFPHSSPPETRAHPP